MAVKLPGLGREMEETKRTSRLLTIILMIASAPKRYTRKHLARHFEISERMITKDLEIVRHGLRLPLERTVEGYFFTSIPKLPMLQLSFAEALAMLNTVQAAQQVTGAGSAELAAAVARLESLFPAEFAPHLRQIRKPKSISAQREHRQQMLSLLNRALLYRNKIEIVYETRSRDGEVGMRVVHPYLIMPYVRSWQLVAYCEKRQNILMFKIDRIHSAAILQELHYEPDPEFDADEYIGNRWGIMRVQGEPEEIVLHFNGEVGRRVSEESWHKSQQTEILADDSVIFRLNLIITPEFVNWLLYYGSGLEVLQPQWLRERVKEEHRKSVERYEKGEESK